MNGSSENSFRSVVKSRLQAGHAVAIRYRSALHGLRTIIAEEGIGGMYRGVGSKLLQSVLTAAILFASQRRIYEMTKVTYSFLYKCQRHTRLLITDQGGYTVTSK
jgi:Mitochondrial carrier protein